jgi:NADPH:quinone reductase-like Zn-dependent oxidoreductase
MSTVDVYEFAPSADTFRLERKHRPSQPLGPHEVRVDVTAVSLNYRDHIALNNLAKRPVGGKIPCSDGAGVVAQVGSEVTLWKVGDRVMGSFFATWREGPFLMKYHQHDLGGTVDGMLAKSVTLAETALVATPGYLTDIEASTLPCAGLTAYQALFVRGGLASGQSVLCLGTGGVSVFALQLAHAAGAQVYVTSSSDEKLTRAKGMGAVATINYRTHPEWQKAVFEATSQRGVEHVVEVGGPGTFEKSMQSVTAGGHIALIGVLTGFGPPAASLFPLVAKNVRLNGIYVGSQAMFQEMNRFLEEHQIHPVVDRVFPYHEAPRAFEHLASGNHFGKVVIDVATPE